MYVPWLHIGTSEHQVETKAVRGSSGPRRNLKSNSRFASQGQVGYSRPVVAIFRRGKSRGRRTLMSSDGLRLPHQSFDSSVFSLQSEATGA